MDRPRIADVRPKVLELEPGTYAYCTCGRSATQPFCDGGHTGTEFRPRMLEIAEPTRAALCQCKMSREAPYCDGAHRLYTKDD